MENNVFQIFPFHDDKKFSEEEAYRLIDLFLVITRRTQNEINSLNSQLELYRTQSEKADSTQFKINVTIQKWSDKIRRLGGNPIALYKVKIPTFNNRSFIWEFPKSSLDLID